MTAACYLYKEAEFREEVRGDGVRDVVGVGGGVGLDGDEVNDLLHGVEPLAAADDGRQVPQPVALELQRRPARRHRGHQELRAGGAARSAHHQHLRPVAEYYLPRYYLLTMNTRWHAGHAPYFFPSNPLLRGRRVKTSER